MEKIYVCLYILKKKGKDDAAGKVGRYPKALWKCGVQVVDEPALFDTYHKSDGKPLCQQDDVADICGYKI